MIRIFLFAERFNVSYKTPSPRVPFPKKAIAICPFFLTLLEYPTPAATGSIPPCIPFDKKVPLYKCWLPPIPLEQPFSDPSNSATKPFKSLVNDR